MVQISISDLLSICGGVVALFSVYLTLNNRIILIGEKGRSTQRELDEEKCNSTKLATQIAENYKELSNALHENSLIIAELKTFLSKSIKH